MDKSTISIITINSKKITTDVASLSYEEICELSGAGRDAQLTVLYTRGHSDKPSGVLVRGQSVKVKDGMEIDAMFTGNA